MANNMQYTNAFGAFVISTVEQSNGSHAIQVVEVPPGTTSNMVNQGFTGGVPLNSQLKSDGSLALNVKLIYT